MDEIRPEILNEIVDLTKTVQMAASDCTPIRNAQDYETAVTLVRDVIHPLIDRVKEEWGPFKKVAHAAWKALVAKEQSYTKPLEAIEGQLKAKASAWKQAQRIFEQRREETTGVPAKRTPKIEGVSARVLLRFVIEDVTLIPREYLIPYEAKIQGVIDEKGKEEAEKAIPGIRVIEKDVIAVGRG